MSTRTLASVFAVLALVGACAGAPPSDPADPADPSLAPPGAPPPPPPSALPGAAASGDPKAPAAPGSADAVGDPGQAYAKGAGKDEGPQTCPGGMVLVSGDYCTQVEHKCKREWFAKANKKRVCEDFEPKATCVGEKIKKRFCIDKYEWPNVAGERPEIMNRFHQAQVKCAAVGKRMCHESEWNFACEGPDMKPFPYGWTRDPLVCNGDHKWDDPNMSLVEKRDARELGRLWRGMRSGSQPGCKSDFGVFDLPGNADEVVGAEADPKLRVPNLRAKFDSVHTGGPWYKGVRNQCRPKVYTHAEDFYYYFLSFRCCAEPDGKPTDPRTQWQQRDGWSMEKVERSAQFTVAQMKEKLELKKKGQCSCGERDVLCKTMCGTLVGPNAKDATTSDPRAPGP